MTERVKHSPDDVRSSFTEPWTELIHCDLEIMCGMPVFVGTRIPVENVTASLACGMNEDQVLRAYPQLTPAHLTAAIAYGACRPECHPTHRLGESNPSWVLTTSEVVKSSTR